ncbi:MAG: DHH family phosphoesterase, partial [Gammaproteobacteria bacterium]
MTHTKIVQRKKNHLPENLKNLHPILQQVYANRGVTNMDDLEKGLSGLLPYNGMLNIDKAITLLYQVMIENKKILIVGDFDADGATSTAVAVSALKSFGVKNVEFLVPNRFEYGYGLTPEIVKVAVKLKPDLLITVDNGISSIAGVEEAHRHNIKVLITDHHLPGQAIPDAEVIINPNQKGCAFSSKCIAGVGVIFYVMLALRSYLREKNWFLEKAVAEPNMADLLDLVALGTIADVVSLDRNNRILVHQGLMRIRQGNCRPGIKALLTIANREQKRLAASDLAFAIAPRLNAAGRLDDMTLGIQCLLSNDFANALDIAKILDELNQERRYIEADMQHQAMQELNKLHLENKKLPAGLCLFDENWHQGVIGILAGRIKDRYHRPVIV